MLNELQDERIEEESSVEQSALVCESTVTEEPVEIPKDKEIIHSVEINLTNEQVDDFNKLCSRNQELGDKESEDELRKWTLSIFDQLMKEKK